MNEKTAVKVLNELIETSEDGKKGFAEAADKATDATLKALFSDRARECGRAVDELQQAVKTLGGSPEEGGSIAGAAHRGWVAVKSAVTDSNIAVLEEVERGEDYAKAAYSKALDAELPPLARAIVQDQYQGVMRNHDRVRELRNSYKRAA